MRLLILFILLFLYNIQGIGQKIKELTVADGLSYGAVRDILQTQDGYLWVATQEGLNRYDGYDFKLFGHTANKEFSLPQNYITTLFEDSKQRLWVATKEKGLFLFNRKLNRFYQCDLKISSKSLGASYTAYKIVEDKAHDLWIGTNESMIFRLQLPKNWDNDFPSSNNFNNNVKIQSYQISNDQKDIISLMVDAKNTLWIGNESGQVFTFDNQKHQVKALEFGTLKIENAKITGIFENY
jgi:ligand-binding sensor domain-containing protein